MMWYGFNYEISLVISHCLKSPKSVKYFTTINTVKSYDLTEVFDGMEKNKMKK